MAGAILEFLGTAIIIVIAGTFLTRCGDAIAELTGLGRLLVGSILIAGATSLPELSVDISAVRLGFPNLAIGDLMGSCLFNLLILAIADLLHRERGRMLSAASAAHALSATMSITLLSLAAISIFLGPQVNVTLLGMGPGCLAILVAYILGARLVYYDQRRGAELAPQVEPPELVPHVQMTLRRAVLGYAGAAAVIVAVAPFMAEAAGELAELSGLGKTFVGTTLVALSTSLPELVATITAIRIGAFDMALGNIFGSNAFNMLVLVALDLVYPGSLLANVAQTHVLTALAAILVTAVAVLGQLYRVEKRIRFVEPDAALVIALVMASLAMVYYLR